METFTLQELVLASQLMFPADFSLLYAKHSGDLDMARLQTSIFKSPRYQCNLLLYIHEYNDEESLEILSKMIRECIGSSEK